MEEGKKIEAPPLPQLPADLDSLPQDKQIEKLIEHVQAQAAEIEKQKKERDDHSETLEKIRQLIIENYQEFDEDATLEELREDLIMRAKAQGKSQEDAEKEVDEKLAPVKEDPATLKGFI